MIRRFWLALGAVAGALAVSAPAALAGDTLLGGQTLTAGRSITSADGRYQLVMQSDGNLVYFLLNGSSSQRSLWSSGTRGDTGDHALLQGNGALVLLDPNNQTLWSTNTSSAGCTNLLAQDDGNLVLYPRNLHAVWATGTRPTALDPGDVLLAGQTIYAPGEQYKLVMQGDGNLVLYDDAGAPIWSSRTSGHPGSRAVMQSDGNLVIYDGATPLWSARTAGHAGAVAALQSDGNFVIYSAGRAIWSTATAASRPTGPLLFHTPAFQPCPPPPAPAPPPPAAAPAPAPPVVSVPVMSPTPKKLRVKIILSWTWDHRTTRLSAITIAHMPRRAMLTVSCHGRGCSGHAKRSDFRHLKRLVRYLDGHAFRAGQRVILVISEIGYRSERVEARIRDGHLPRVRLLR